MLADPAEAAFFCDRLLEDGCTIDENPVTKCPNAFFNTSCQCPESSFHDLVIVTTECVARDVRARLMIKQGPGVILWFRQIIHANRNDAQRSGYQVLWPAALYTVPFHIVH